MDCKNLSGSEELAGLAAQQNALTNIGLTKWFLLIGVVYAWLFLGEIIFLALNVVENQPERA